jgi:acetyl-CoA carboxylase carboxyl transferase subunit alpha
VIDDIIAEPVGGAHREPAAAVATVGAAVAEALDTLGLLNADELRAQRRDRFMAIGRFETENAPAP